MSLSNLRAVGDTGAGRRAVLHGGFAALAASFSVCSLLGWTLDVEILTTLVPDRPALSPMTALLLLAGAGAALALPRRRRVAMLLGATVAACGAGIAVVQILALPAMHWLPAVWWSSRFSGALFAFVGTAALLLARRHHAVGQLIAFGVLLCVGLMGLAHVFPRADLYRYVPGTGVAVPTVLAVGCLSLSLLLVCRAEGVVGALGARTLVGRTGLRLWLVGLASELVLAAAVLQLHRQQAFDTESAILLVAWGAVALFGAALWGVAIKVDSAEKARHAAERERDEIRKMVAAALTHDLRTPLQSAMLSASVLALAASREQSAAALERLQRSHRRLDRMSRSLLDALVLGGGRPLRLHATAVSLRDLVAEVIDENRGVLGAQVVYLGEADGWWDEDALFRVIENLLMNAAKYGEPSRPIVCRIEQPGRDEVSLAVDNEGQPIPAAEWETIFQPFSRGAGALDVGTGGWGVGLAYVRAVALGHGGTVFVEHSDAKSTRFVLRLPADARPWLTGASPL